MEIISSAPLMTIEDGYFVLSLMPSLKCSLNCPHCFIPHYSRKKADILSIENLEKICKKIDLFYSDKNIKRKTIILEWIGGEPTEMGLDYFSSAVNTINKIFSPAGGYQTEHLIITSLVNVNIPVWTGFFQKEFNKKITTSYDGHMRGKGYVKKWAEKVREAVKSGLDVSVLSVVNSDLVSDGPEKTMNFLADLGVKDISFSPFVSTTSNDREILKKYNVGMGAWNDFLIEIGKYFFDKKTNGIQVPEINQLKNLLLKENTDSISNTFSRSMQLYPNGDMVLSQLENGVTNTASPLGNLLEESFDNILKSEGRKKLIKNQLFKGHIRECQLCDYSDRCLMQENADKCVMEPWKSWEEGQECLGGKRFINWVFDYIKKNNINYRDLMLG